MSCDLASASQLGHGSQDQIGKIITPSLRYLGRDSESLVRFFMAKDLSMSAR